MKWHELYKYLVFEESSDQLSDILGHIASGDAFELQLVEQYDDGDEPVSKDELKASFAILSIEATKAGLKMVVKTKSQVLPAGVKHGTYTICCDCLDAESGVTKPPPEMFEDGDVPEELIPKSRSMKQKEAT